MDGELVFDDVNVLAVGVGNMARSGMDPYMPLTYRVHSILS